MGSYEKPLDVNNRQVLDEKGSFELRTWVKEKGRVLGARFQGYPKDIIYQDSNQRLYVMEGVLEHHALRACKMQENPISRSGTSAIAAPPTD